MTDNTAIIAAIRKVDSAAAATGYAAEGATVDFVPPGYTLAFGPSDGANNAVGVSVTLPYLLVAEHHLVHGVRIYLSPFRCCP